MGGVGDELAFDAPDADGAQRPVPRNIADDSAAEAPIMLRMSGIIFAVGAQHHGLDLDFVIPALGKERADGAVGQAAGEDFFFRRAAFAFEIAAGEFACRRGFFAVIDGEREEILAWLGLGGGHGGDQDDGFAELDGHGAVGLFGEFAGFDMICLSPTWADTFSGIGSISQSAASEKLQ